jgi:protein-S-isoprenylcysteine O-methyltransferase Ste14
MLRRASPATDWRKIRAPRNFKLSDFKSGEDVMNLLGEVPLGIAILLLLGMLVIVKRMSTGAILDRPEGSFLVQLVNVFNLFFLLVVNPVAAVLLLAGPVDGVDPTHVYINEKPILVVIELTGLLLYTGGFFLMAWALITLGKNYQLGGSAPRREDRMITGGPYGRIRHPMYTSALTISVGLALLAQSWALLCVFCVYLVLILKLIPMEEERLLNAYGEQYQAYQRKTPRLI